MANIWSVTNTMAKKLSAPIMLAKKDGGRLIFAYDYTYIFCALRKVGPWNKVKSQKKLNNNFFQGETSKPKY